MDSATAYLACEQVTRQRARNFYYGIRLLPPAKRKALCSVYAFARRVDDIADGPRSTQDKLRLLGAARADLARLAGTAAEAGRFAEDPVLSALADAGARFALPLEAFADLVDGVEMDVVGTAYGRFDELELYCRRVAGSIGRLSAAVFGAADPARAASLSDHLGVGMQLTNILRDVAEDRTTGRVYLPTEDLDRFGWDPMAAARPGPEFDRLVRFEAARARRWFAMGLTLLPLLDRRSAACVSAMTGIYRRILDRIERRPRDVLVRRVSLPGWEKAWVAVSSLRPDGSGRVASAAGLPGGAGL